MKLAVLATFGLTRYVPSGHLLLVAEFQRNISRYQDLALKEPVAVTRNGRERTVMRIFDRSPGIWISSGRRAVRAGTLWR
jgi:hypothetical protein